MLGNDNNKKEVKHHAAPGEKEEIKEQKEASGAITLKEEEYNKLLSEVLKAKEYQEKMLRFQADFENARKRLEKQSQDFVKYATEGIILELLNILDDLERTVQAAEAKNTSADTFLKGIEMILAHLYEMLKEHGVKVVDVKGKMFDHNTSEALMQAESDVSEGIVIEEMQKGYFLNDKIIRTAKVKVSKGKGNSEEQNIKK